LKSVAVCWLVIDIWVRAAPIRSNAPPAMSPSSEYRPSAARSGHVVSASLVVLSMTRRASIRRQVDALLLQVQLGAPDGQLAVAHHLGLAGQIQFLLGQIGLLAQLGTLLQRLAAQLSRPAAPAAGLRPGPAAPAYTWPRSS
jgi:hypothetical protein